MVNHRIVLNVLGNIIWRLGFIMLIPFAVALYYGDPEIPYAFGFAVTAIFGLTLSFVFPDKGEEWEKREGFAIVALGWLMVALFGSIPYILLDHISLVDALFESMSGFTTTGATVLSDIDGEYRSLLLWRSLTQWLGGMGIIMLFIAILPKLGVAGRQMFRAEAPGPTEDKLKPRIRETAVILWKIYVGISVIELFLLWFFTKMDLFDAVTHTFTTMACGGFSPYGQSIAYFNDPLIEGIITFFMILAGANFALHYKILRKGKINYARDDELRFYVFIITAGTLILTFLLYRDMYGDIAISFRYAAFQIVSIITTTGYASVDFNQWTDPSLFILLLMMFIGGCAGSTAGGVKVVRILLLLKYARREIFKAVHPRAVRPIKLNGRTVPADVMQAIISFVVIYFLIFILSSGILAILGLDLITSVTASIATLGNIGPGFAVVGPMASFASIPAVGKLVLIANMWIGRLEVFTVIVLLMPEFWKR